VITSLLLLVGIICFYYLSYLFSLTAGGLYLTDYDEQKFIESLPVRKQHYLLYLLNNPTQVAATATVVQTVSLVASTICWFLIGTRLNLPDPHRYPIAVLLVAFGWLAYLLLIEVLAPNLKQERVLQIVQSRYRLLKTMMVICSPLVLYLISQKDKLIDKQDLDEKKEEIVERAIESLAESAGIDEPLVERDVKRMIGNIFDLADSEVREVMVPRVEMVAIEKGATLETLQRLLEESGHSRFPVYDGDVDNIMGVLYVKDVFQKLPLPDGATDLTRFARPAYFVPESKELDKLLGEFRAKKIHIAIVVDEYGGTAGLVTLEDLLELIVGDIQDEHDVEEEDVVKLSDREYLVSANLSMDDLSEKLNLKLEEKDFETVGGYIYDLVGSLPRVGQRVTTDGIEYVVEKVSGQRIVKVKIVLRKTENT
jgi:CBS domain containing-hemolysin-like protein